MVGVGYFESLFIANTFLVYLVCPYPGNISWKNLRGLCFLLLKLKENEQAAILACSFN